MNLWPRASLSIASVLVVAASCAACGNIGEVSSPTMVVNPTELGFAATAIGDSTTQFITIGNEGQATLIVSDFEDDLTSDYISVDMQGTVEILPNQEVVFSVRYAPTGTEQTFGSLYVISNDRQSERFEIDINVIDPAPRLVVQPDPVDFGIVPEQSVIPADVLFQNFGTAPLIICDARLGGSLDMTTDLQEMVALAGGYPLFINVSGFPTEGGVDEFPFTITYEPTSPGADLSNLLVDFDPVGDVTRACENEDEIETQSVEVTGEAGQPLLDISPCPIDFGESAFNNSKDLGIAIRNLGNIDLDIYEIQLDERSSGDFSLSSLPNLTLTLTPDESDAFIANFVPSDYVARAGIVNVLHSDGIGGTTTTSCPISGVGVDNDCPFAVAEGRILQDPQVRRGSEIDWAVPLQTLILDATQSFDANGDTITYEWEILEQPDGAINGLREFDGDPQNTALRQYFVPVAGRYVFQVTATDETGCASEPALVRVLAIPDEAISIELTWYNPADPDENDDEGSDADLHFIRIGEGAWSSTADTYFGSREPVWGEELPSLDFDDTDGAGPETIQLDNPGACSWYAVGVHHFAQRFGTAYATVRVYINGVLAGEYTNQALESTDDFWDVARIHWPTGQVYEVTDPIIENFDSSDGITPIVPEGVDPTLICD